MKEYFSKLYQYNAWANSRVLGALQQQKVDHERILTLMSHILSAQFIWLHRIQGLPVDQFPLWKKYELPELVRMGEEVGANWLKFIDANTTFNRQLTYRNYTGDPYVNNVEHIMMHLVNHCTYHRGQIALLLRQQGYEPVNTDFITYDRVVTGQLNV